MNQDNSRSEAPTFLGAQRDAALRPGEAILAVRVQATSGLSDAEAPRRFGPGCAR